MQVEHDVEVLTADGNAESIGQAICNRAQQLQVQGAAALGAWSVPADRPEV